MIFRRSSYNDTLMMLITILVSNNDASAAPCNDTIVILIMMLVDSSLDKNTQAVPQTLSNPRQWCHVPSVFLETRFPVFLLRFIQIQ